MSGLSIAYSPTGIALQTSGGAQVASLWSATQNHGYTSTPTVSVYVAPTWRGPYDPAYYFNDPALAVVAAQSLATRLGVPTVDVLIYDGVYTSVINVPQDVNLVGMGDGVYLQGAITYTATDLQHETTFRNLYIAGTMTLNLASAGTAYKVILEDVEMLSTDLTATGGWVELTDAHIDGLVVSGTKVDANNTKIAHRLTATSGAALTLVGCTSSGLTTTNANGFALNGSTAVCYGSQLDGLLPDATSSVDARTSVTTSSLGRTEGMGVYDTDVVIRNVGVLANTPTHVDGYFKFSSSTYTVTPVLLTTDYDQYAPVITNKTTTGFTVTAVSDGNWDFAVRPINSGEVYTGTSIIPTTGLVGGMGPTGPALLAYGTSIGSTTPYAYYSGYAGANTSYSVTANTPVLMASFITNAAPSLGVTPLTNGITLSTLGTYFITYTLPVTNVAVSVSPNFSAYCATVSTAPLPGAAGTLAQSICVAPANGTGGGYAPVVLTQSFLYTATASTSIYLYFVTPQTINVYYGQGVSLTAFRISN